MSLATQTLTSSAIPIPKSIQTKFEELANELSPENLSCDGELTDHEVSERYLYFIGKWRGLEATVGRKVSESEVYQFNK